MGKINLHINALSLSLNALERAQGKKCFSLSLLFLLLFSVCFLCQGCQARMQLSLHLSHLRRICELHWGKKEKVESKTINKTIKQNNILDIKVKILFDSVKEGYLQ